MHCYCFCCFICLPLLSLLINLTIVYAFLLTMFKILSKILRFNFQKYFTSTLNTKKSESFDSTGQFNVDEIKAILESAS